MWRFSTELRSRLMEAKESVHNYKEGTTISFTANGGGSSIHRISDSANGMANFQVGDWVTVKGSANNNNKFGQIVAVNAAYIDVSGGDTFLTESAGTNALVISARGGSLKGIFRNGVVGIYSGTQPTTADDAEAGSLLCLITLASGAFTPGSPINGINFGQVSAGTIGKALGEVWSGANVATGSAGWARFYANDKTTGASTTTARLDCSVATSGAQLNLTSTSLVSGVTTTIDTVAITMPAS